MYWNCTGENGRGGGGGNIHSSINGKIIQPVLNHSCLIWFSGVSSGPPVLMILELVPLGSMLEFLTDHPESVRVDMEIPLWVRNHFHINFASFKLLLK